MATEMDSTEKIYAFANQKGGVGKTTSAINIAAALGTMSQSVLLIDIDPQGNATSGSGLNMRELENTTADVLLNDARIDDISMPTNNGYDLVPTSRALVTMELDLINRERREYILRDAVEQIEKPYDYIFIDCPPALSMLTVNGLTAARFVIAPIQCEYFALEGLSALQETIERLREKTNPDLELEGLFRTMYDARNNLARDVSNALEEHFSEILYKTMVPRNVTLAEAPSHGQAGVLYDKYSNGAAAYLSLAREFRRRSGR